MKSTIRSTARWISVRSFAYSSNQPPFAQKSFCTSITSNLDVAGSTRSGGSGGADPGSFIGCLLVHSCQGAGRRATQEPAGAAAPDEDAVADDHRAAEQDRVDGAADLPSLVG